MHNEKHIFKLIDDDQIVLKKPHPEKHTKKKKKRQYVIIVIHILNLFLQALRKKNTNITS